MAILSAAIYGYTARTFFEAGTFATRMSDGLAQPEIARIVADEVADQIIAIRRDLVAFRPLIHGSLESVVRSHAFRALVRKAIKESHQTVISETGTSITLTLNDAEVIVHSALTKFPEIAEKLPPGSLEVLGKQRSWPGGKVLAQILRIEKELRLRAIFLFGLGLVTGAAGLALARDRARFLLQCAIAMTSLAFLVGITAMFGGPLFARLADSVHLQRLISGLWPAFVGPLALRMWVLCGMGLVVVAGVTSTLNQIKFSNITRVLRWLSGQTPSNRWLAMLRAFVVVALSVVIFFNPVTTAVIIVAAAAVVAFFMGVQEIFLLVGELEPRETVVKTVSSGGHGRKVTSVVLVLASIGAGAWWLVAQDGTPPPQLVVDSCNGYPELCDRRLNEVVIPTTHNSMSGGDISNWMFPNQEKGVAAQLAAGIRGFMLDVHYGVPVGQEIKTLLIDEANARATYEEVLGKEGVDAAMRIRDRLVGKETGERDVYLAHGFCELGNSLFTDVLEQMHVFLMMNPGEIIVIIIQDEGVTPQDVAKCFEKSGLLRLVYKDTAAPPWPTLREMVDSDQRVLVLGEHVTEGVDWYHPAFEVCQETPYRFLNPSEISNEPNRGGTSGSLLLMNNWIETAPAALPSNADIVNAYDFLLERAVNCQDERGMLINFLAVDFYRTGDLLRVVDKLNGFEPAP